MATFSGRHPASRLAQAMKRWGYTSLTELHRASVDRPERFWKVALDDLGIMSAAPWTAVSDELAGRKFPAWFPGARLNIAAHCVDRYAAWSEDSSRVAVIYEGDLAPAAR